LGLGVGQFKGRFQEFYQEENHILIRRIIERNYFLSPHSDYMAILIIYGVVGLVFYLLFLLFTGRKIVFFIRNSISVQQKIHYQTSLLIFMILVMFGTTSESFNSALFWILLSICSTTESLKLVQENEEIIQIEE
jgi:O-antigen ligase